MNSEDKFMIIVILMAVAIVLSSVLTELYIPHAESTISQPLDDV